MRQLCLWIIHGYRLMISPLLGPACRFEPTCSRYALDAVNRYGALQGLGLTLVRLMKCHPFHPGGEDPVK
ncbi:MAG: membrane protein insertion efficiency factor YidD [Nitrospira sp.]|nr:membrane protein insertion efficiency factor YidD [Nitrospira sp.]MBH0180120.1 membrane protein insertion efficiency factor YidD [Nitrospira sp.]MBH0185333.1 membrane protein insertion efficiency factor YidD [Nitrospira sp.]